MQTKNFTYSVRFDRKGDPNVLQEPLMIFVFGPHARELDKNNGHLGIHNLNCTSECYIMDLRMVAFEHLYYKPACLRMFREFSFSYPLQALLYPHWQNAVDCLDSFFRRAEWTFRRVT